MRFSAAATAVIVGTCVQARSMPSTDLQPRLFGLEHNDFSCQPSKSQNPVVLLHGLGATFYEDINLLESRLKSEGLCTFSLTYGAYPGFPLVGGLASVDESTREIADFVRRVKQETGSKKVDLVGHSEGAFMTLYTAKFGGIAKSLERIVAIAPPTHGTDFGSLYSLAESTGLDEIAKTVLSAVGCKACAELVHDGVAIQNLNDGPITQKELQYTVITSKNDKLVSPPETAFIEEDGVMNLYVQDYCPSDAVGHIGEAYDPNVWQLVLNSLKGEFGQGFDCTFGFPIR